MCVCLCVDMLISEEKTFLKPSELNDRSNLTVCSPANVFAHFNAITTQIDQQDAWICCECVRHSHQDQYIFEPRLRGVDRTIIFDMGLIIGNRNHHHYARQGTILWYTKYIRTNLQTIDPWIYISSTSIVHWQIRRRLSAIKKIKKNQKKEKKRKWDTDMGFYLLSNCLVLRVFDVPFPRITKFICFSGLWDLKMEEKYERLMRMDIQIFAGDPVQ